MEANRKKQKLKEQRKRWRKIVDSWESLTVASEQSFLVSLLIVSVSSMHRSSCTPVYTFHRFSSFGYVYAFKLIKIDLIVWNGCSCVCFFALSAICARRKSNKKVQTATNNTDIVRKLQSFTPATPTVPTTPPLIYKQKATYKKNFIIYES